MKRRVTRRRRQRGVASSEYLVLLSMVGISLATAALGWGPPLVRSFAYTRAVIVSPTP
jgi:hypothetical protein